MTGATANSEALSTDDLIDEKYRGIRPAYGYSGVPRSHGEKRKPFHPARRRARDRHRPHRQLRHAPGGVGEWFGLLPPQARYFAVDKITQDQVENYARRKGVPIEEIERWLSPNLGYDR